MIKKIFFTILLSFSLIDSAWSEPILLGEETKYYDILLDDNGTTRRFIIIQTIISGAESASHRGSSSEREIIIIGEVDQNSDFNTSSKNLLRKFAQSKNLPTNSSHPNLSSHLHSLSIDAEDLAMLRIQFQTNLQNLAENKARDNINLESHHVRNEERSRKFYEPKIKKSERTVTSLKNNLLNILLKIYHNSAHFNVVNTLIIFNSASQHSPKGSKSETSSWFNNVLKSWATLKSDKLNEDKITPLSVRSSSVKFNCMHLFL